MAAKPQTIDEYLATLNSEQRSTLEKVREAIRSAAPRAEECISYQIPSFRLEGKLLVSFAAWSNHCAFYPGSKPLEVHQHALKNYDISKGTIRFPIGSALPTTLVRKLVKTRIEQNAGRRKS